MSSSWKLESSQAIHAFGSTRPASADSGRPTFPATSHARPPERSIAPRSSVVVVLPFVPVTPAIGLGSIRAASSTSLHTGTPAARAATTWSVCDGTPGLFTTALSPCTGTTSPPRTGSTPSSRSLPTSISAR